MCSKQERKRERERELRNKRKRIGKKIENVPNVAKNPKSRTPKKGGSAMEYNVVVAVELLTLAGLNNSKKTTTTIEGIVSQKTKPNPDERRKDLPHFGASIPSHHIHPFAIILNPLLIHSIIVFCLSNNNNNNKAINQLQLQSIQSNSNTNTNS